MKLAFLSFFHGLGPNIYIGVGQDRMYSRELSRAWIIRAIPSLQDSGIRTDELPKLVLINLTCPFTF